MMFGCLGDIIWRNEYIGLRNKIRIYETRVRPVMTYAIETIAETTATKHLQWK